MALDIESIKSKITEWLIEEGFEVKKMPVPPKAKLRWGLEALTPPPIRIKLNILSIPQRDDVVFFRLPVSLSDTHQKAYSKLDKQERIRLYFELYRSLLTMCPKCHVILAPNPTDLKNIMVSRMLFLDNVTRQSLSDTMTMLMNSFIVISAVLNANLSHQAPESAGLTMHI
ncbi:MAG: DUF2299 family protein [Desulfurococcales archaeon]|nr:DUF2299 family protein [Desulfurococcales archaeon]